MVLPQLVMLVILVGFSAGSLHSLSTWNKNPIVFLPKEQRSGNPGVLSSLILSFRLCNTELENLKYQLTQALVSRLLSHHWSLLSLDLKSHMEAVESGLSSSISFINKTFWLFPKHFFSDTVNFFFSLYSETFVLFQNLWIPSKHGDSHFKQLQPKSKSGKKVGR